MIVRLCQIQKSCLALRRKVVVQYGARSDHVKETRPNEWSVSLWSNVSPVSFWWLEALLPETLYYYYHSALTGLKIVSCSNRYKNCVWLQQIWREILTFSWKWLLGWGFLVFFQAIYRIDKARISICLILNIALGDWPDASIDYTYIGEEYEVQFWRSFYRIFDVFLKGFLKDCLKGFWMFFLNDFLGQVFWHIFLKHHSMGFLHQYRDSNSIKLKMTIQMLYLSHTVLDQLLLFLCKILMKFHGKKFKHLYQ